MKWTKAQFVKGLETLKQMYAEEEKFCEGFGGVGVLAPEWVGFQWICKYYDLLREGCDFDDDDENEWGESLLDMWCFEWDMGSSRLTPIEYHTIADLYDAIVEEQTHKS